MEHSLFFATALKIDYNLDFKKKFQFLVRKNSELKPKTWQKTQAYAHKLGTYVFCEWACLINHK